MQWSYKTVHFSLKKEGLLGSAFLDENEVEISLNEYGRLGWELVSFQEVNDGLIAIFKQPFAQGIAPVAEEPVLVQVPENSTQQEVKIIPVTSSPEVSTEEAQQVESSNREDVDVGSIRIL